MKTRPPRVYITKKGRYYIKSSGRKIYLKGLRDIKYSRGKNISRFENHMSAKKIVNYLIGTIDFHRNIASKRTKSQVRNKNISFQKKIAPQMKENDIGAYLPSEAKAEGENRNPYKGRPGVYQHPDEPTTFIQNPSASENKKFADFVAENVKNVNNPQQAITLIQNLQKLDNVKSNQGYTPTELANMYPDAFNKGLELVPITPAQVRQSKEEEEKKDIEDNEEAKREQDIADEAEAIRLSKEEEKPSRVEEVEEEEEEPKPKPKPKPNIYEQIKEILEGRPHITTKGIGGILKEKNGFETSTEEIENIVGEINKEAPTKYIPPNFEGFVPEIPRKVLEEVEYALSKTQLTKDVNLKRIDKIIKDHKLRAHIPEEIMDFYDTTKNDLYERKKKILQAILKIIAKRVGSGKYSKFRSGLYDDQIQTILRKKTKRIVPVIMNDELPLLLPYITKHTKVFPFVVNNKNHNQQGEHWVGAIIDKSRGQICYYDSYGNNPSPTFMRDVKLLVDRMDPEIYLKFKINRIKQQGNTNNCGYFVSKFIIDYLKGKKFRECSGFDRSNLGEEEITRFKDYL